MLVTEDTIYDTIGGGHLEHQAIAKARELLAKGEQIQHIEHYPLASKLGQCCGGATNVLFEVFNRHTQHLLLFGAGHVAKSLIPVISQLPLQITWSDSRAEMFSGITVPENVQTVVEDDPSFLLDDLPNGSWMLVMTHDHQLDFELVHLGLAHSALSYVGMIGSDTKARRFTRRLAQQGVSDGQMSQFVCPVGLSEIPGKKPIEVAISIAGQLIQMLNPIAPDVHTKESWKQTKQIAKLI